MDCTFIAGIACTPHSENPGAWVEKWSKLHTCLEFAAAKDSIMPLHFNQADALVCFSEKSRIQRKKYCMHVPKHSRRRL